ncbi:helix-turn-helix domain-containing protein [Tsukamurella pulmonis]|uniref:helix-turn-helix domain-containing protein n=1 Tax=Tsukamurella pulmonis TaxID=47312 RepID=UPI000E099801|nr:helix-turn-helix transcriptional regulator [Tsukamurella pulmonis]RDH13563.1 XRE family transcriptional regulator [Tsukamurella pulmonis]
MTSPREPVNVTLAEFGARIRARRKELGLSQEGLAHRSSIHWTNVARAERGLHRPRIENIVRLARGLETTPGALLDDLPLEGDDGPTGTPTTTHLDQG